MSISYADLFAKWGKLAFCFDTLNTARRTTVPDELQDALDEFAGETVDILACVDNLPDALTSWQQNAGSLLADIQTSAIALLIAVVAADNPQPDDSQQTAYLELLRQMDADSASVDANTVAATFTAAVSNVGSGSLLISTKRGDGLEQEFSYAEDIELLCDSGGETASFAFAGEETADFLSEQWPGGSGASGSLTAFDATLASLITNGSFESEDDLTDFPDGWILVTGTVGTTIRITNAETQTVVISGSPSAGTYVLKFTDSGSRVHTTAPLDYNATSADVQEALRALPGADEWEVTQSGTSPNFTHTIEMLGGPGNNVTQLTSTSSLTGGTPVITHATTVAGGISFRGAKSLEFIGGATLNTIQYFIPIANLDRLTQYGINIFARIDVVPAAGTIEISLWDGNAVINDEQGVPNTLTIDATALLGAWSAHSAAFRTPSDLPAAAYLRIETTAAISAGSSVFLDMLALVEMEELYTGGPAAKMFTGSVNWEIGDRAQIDVTNDRAGQFQNWVHRILQDPERMLPSDAAGTETINDSLIS